MRMTTAPDRLYHLDALRCFAMLFGVLVHANALQKPFPAIGFASQHFRMALFFLISGFFVARVAERDGTGAMLRRRSLAIGVPLLAMLALFQPLAERLMVAWSGAPPLAVVEEEQGPVMARLTQLHHLWFLVSLGIYAALAPALLAALDRPRVRRFSTVLAQTPGDALIIGFALGVGALTALLLEFHEDAVRRFLGPTPFDWTARATLQYLPFFALGLALQRTPALLERAHRVSWPALILGVGLVMSFPLTNPNASAASASAVFARAALSLAIVAALLAIGRRLFARPNPVTTALTGSIYTVYLFHFMAVYALGAALAPHIPDPRLHMVVVAALAFLVSFALHFWLIAPAPFLQFVFNGRLPR